MPDYYFNHYYYFNKILYLHSNKRLSSIIIIIIDYCDNVMSCVIRGHYNLTNFNNTRKQT